MLRHVPNIKVLPGKNTFKLAVYDKFNQGTIYKSVGSMKGKEAGLLQQSAINTLKVEEYTKRGQIPEPRDDSCDCRRLLSGSCGHTAVLQGESRRPNNRFYLTFFPLCHLELVPTIDQTQLETKWQGRSLISVAPWTSPGKKSRKSTQLHPDQNAELWVNKSLLF